MMFFSARDRPPLRELPLKTTGKVRKHAKKTCLLPTFSDSAGNVFGEYPDRFIISC